MEIVIRLNEENPTAQVIYDLVKKQIYNSLADLIRIQILEDDEIKKHIESVRKDLIREVKKEKSFLNKLRGKYENRKV